MPRSFPCRCWISRADLIPIAHRAPKFCLRTGSAVASQAPIFCRICRICRKGLRCHQFHLLSFRNKHKNWYRRKRHRSGIYVTGSGYHGPGCAVIVQNIDSGLARNKSTRQKFPVQCAASGEEKGMSNMRNFCLVGHEYCQTSGRPHAYVIRCRGQMGMLANGCH